MGACPESCASRCDMARRMRPGAVSALLDKLGLVLIALTAALIVAGVMLPRILGSITLLFIFALVGRCLWFFTRG